LTEEEDRLWRRGCKTALVWEAEWPNRVEGSWAIPDLPGALAGGVLWSREGSGRPTRREGEGEGESPLRIGLAVYRFDIPRSGEYRRPLAGARGIPGPGRFTVETHGSSVARPDSRIAIDRRLPGSGAAVPARRRLALQVFGFSDR